jgi:hypothetical protein
LSEGLAAQHLVTARIDGVQDAGWGNRSFGTGDAAAGYALASLGRDPTPLWHAPILAPG